MEKQQRLSLGMFNESLNALVAIAGDQAEGDVLSEIKNACLYHIGMQGGEATPQESAKSIMECARRLAIQRHHRAEVQKPRVATAFAGGAERYVNGELPQSILAVMFALGYINGMHRNDVIRDAIGRYIEHRKVCANPQPA